MSLADLVPAGEELTTSVDASHEQRQAWFEQRRGKFTCSRFGDLMSTGRGKDEDFSQTGLRYIYQIAAERLGSHRFEFESAPTRWGHENESLAIAAYCERGFASLDDIISGTESYCQLSDWVGGTPDGLIGASGCVEVKCPYDPAEHISYVVDDCIPAKYIWQVRGHLLVSGRDYCDFISFDPRMVGPKRLFVKRMTARSQQNELNALATKLELAVALVRKIVGPEPQEPKM